MTITTGSDGWAALLQAVTDRNASRLTLLEVDGPDFGAQIEEVNLPLRGIAYDRRSGRVEIMLGQLAGPDGHVTHAVPGVVAVDVLISADGRDQAVRIANRDSQSLLRFV